MLFWHKHIILDQDYRDISTLETRTPPHSELLQQSESQMHTKFPRKPFKRLLFQKLALSYNRMFIMLFMRQSNSEKLWYRIGFLVVP